MGAAMGSGADAAIEAADVVYMTSSMEAIPAIHRIAKKTGAIATQNVVFALAVKVLVMILGLGLCLHVDGRTRRFRRGHALRVKFHPGII